MHLMGEMSQLAKRSGLIVSMAPAESYMDPSSSIFDHILLHNYPEWEELQPDFHYHGRNPYAYIYEKYGAMEDGTNTFDFVSIQLYEGYSHALYNITISPQVSPSEYLISFVNLVSSGWIIETGNQASEAIVKIPPSQLVIGLANGWADNRKFLLIWPEDLEDGYNALNLAGFNPRGFMFWDIADEGISTMDPSGEMRPFWMARGLNRILRTRPITVKFSTTLDLLV